MAGMDRNYRRSNVACVCRLVLNPRHRRVGARSGQTGGIGL